MKEGSVGTRVDRVVPVLPVRDVAAALALYRRLGFAGRGVVAWIWRESSAISNLVETVDLGI